ncbi:MAG: hypothetical protein LC778_10395 [Acidobacteria bacterium]|nr:hypothetical protein [Acidobacteriota bacterium]
MNKIGDDWGKKKVQMPGRDIEITEAEHQQDLLIQMYVLSVARKIEFIKYCLKG